MRYQTTMAQIGNNTGVPVLADVLDALGGCRRPAVTLKVNGFQYRSTVGSMGGEFLVPFSAESGIAGGDALTVDIELDTAPRTVEPPTDLSEAMDAAGASVLRLTHLAPPARRRTSRRLSPRRRRRRGRAG